MFPKQKYLASLVAALAVMSPQVADAKKSRPASIDEMWRIIEQQQKQIEELKARVTQNETAKSGAAQTAMVSPPVSETSSATGARTTAATASGGKAAKTEAERKTDILSAEVEKLKTQLYIPDKREYKVEYGYGPAASEVYRVNRGLSIGGYGEWAYSDNTGDAKSTIDNLRAVIYAGYKFNDWIILNNEFEFEHGTTGEGSEEKGEVSVEFSYLDFLLKDYANVRAGLTLVPMGFINEIHEGPTFHGNYRPQVERIIIPTTWREIGAGLFGELAPGLQYRMYVMNGLNAEGFSSGGIREGRQSGSKAIAEDFAFTGRIDYDMPFAPGLLAGASAWVGNSGQGYEYSSPEFGAQRVNALTQLYEGHIQWRWQGLEMRAIGAVGNVGNAAQLSAAKGETIGSQNYGWYTEAAYNLMPWLWKDSSQYLAPFFRYESYNTLAEVPDGFDDYGGYYNQWIYQGGLTYKPIENVAVKFDYRNFNTGAGAIPSQYNLGVAFMY